MNMFEGMSKEKLRAEAYWCQDGVNLRAIARLLVAAVDRACDQDGGTDASYADAAVIIIADKIQSLVRSENVWNAMEACRKAYQAERDAAPSGVQE